ncbi:MAG: alpha-amylase family glycosyl hydrolase [Candidatus Eremiobacteraeota bacterium]|nr:alpha-amylase family glycosyl hydrolase [Candidatus Eremiobacteraeota bacterium]
MRTERSLKELTLHIPKDAFPSPADWRDQVLYLIIVDRFSDGKEQLRPLYDPSYDGNALDGDGGARWRNAGITWEGGTLKGIISKLDYLQGLGITTLWLSPVFRQRADWRDIAREYSFVTYHGYGIQNFLDVDPHFGTREDLKDLVAQAHQRGMYVILDIIHNHTGNNWYYQGFEGVENLRNFPSYRGEPYPFGGWRTRKGGGFDGAIEEADDAVWPVEFQNPRWYSRKGAIVNWDTEPEYREGDFYELKDLDHENREVLDALIKIYRFWIYYTDCDGFRIDAVKHVGLDTSRKFCNAIREYAELIGKHNFMLMGEVAGSEHIALEYLADTTQSGLNSVLDINGPPRAMEKVIKGFLTPMELFQYYTKKSNLPLASHREMGKFHVSILDDHDQVWRYPEEGKARFLADNPFPEQIVPATGFQLTSLGIPSIYYGNEQGFDGKGGVPYADRWVRESMFGGEFGAKRTRGVHFFNDASPLYRKISKICAIRACEPTLRYGRQYFRQISRGGEAFRWPEPKEIIAWSRILAGEEILVAINTNAHEPRHARILVESELHEAHTRMEYLFSSNGPIDHAFSEVLSEGKYKCVDAQVPPMGMIIMKRRE